MTLESHQPVFVDPSMNAAERLDQHFTSSETTPEFSEAVLTLDDGTRLCFCHTVEQRWAKAVGPEDAPSSGGLAGELIEQVTGFRLNAKHLDVQFADGSRFDRPLKPVD